jgi:hypothetical protein
VYIYRDTHSLRATPARASIKVSTPKFRGLEQKINSGRTFKWASILHAPPNLPSQPLFLEALYTAPPNCGSHSFFYFFIFLLFSSHPHPLPAEEPNQRQSAAYLSPRSCRRFSAPFPAPAQASLRQGFFLPTARFLPLVSGNGRYRFYRGIPLEFKFQTKTASSNGTQGYTAV